MHCFVAGIFLLVATGLSAPARADAMRCGSGIVRDGDGQARLLQLCGPPESVENRSILRRPHFRRGGRIIYYGEAEVAVPVELWTYNFGPNQLMRRIRIVDGIIEEIEVLGHGHPPRPAARR